MRMNYFDLLQKQARLYPNQVFVILDDTPYTYKQFEEKVRRFEFEMDLKEQPVFIQSPSLSVQLLAFFAVMKLGGVPILCHETLSPSQVELMMKTNHIPFYLSEAGWVKQMVHSKSVTACHGVLSSGSTGLPKVMYRSFESWVDFFPIQNEVFKLSKSSVVFMQGSLSFTGNLNVLLATLFEGGTVVLTSSLLVRHWIKQFQSYDVTVMYLVPAKIELLCKQKMKPLRDIQSVFMGSQLLSNHAITRLKATFPNALIQLYYGASEVSYVSYLNIDEVKNQTCRIGKPFSNVSVEIEDGRIAVQTPCAIDGVELPFLLEDIGHFDDEGYLMLDGRVDDIVNVAGVKVSLLKIEQALKQHEYVRDVAVLAKSHELKGREVVAYVVSQERISEVSLLANLSKLERPNKIRYVSYIPRNNMGKVIKSDLNRLIYR